MAGRGGSAISGGGPPWGGGGGSRGGGGKGQHGVVGVEEREDFRYNSQLPAGIRNGLRMRKRNKKMVQLDFSGTAEFPDEEAFWKWLEREQFTDIEGMDMDYIEREVLERKYYICMKDEKAANLMVERFKEEEVLYMDRKMVDHCIIAKHHYCNLM